MALGVGVSDFDVAKTMTKTYTRCAVVGVAVVSVALMLSACDPAGTPLQRAGGRCVVGVVGDSLIVGARDLGGLQAKFVARGCTVTSIDAGVGWSSFAGAEAVEAWNRNGALPEIVVVALGTNDCTARTFETNMRRILAAVGERPVVYVTTWRSGCDVIINPVMTRIQYDELNTRSDQGNLWIFDHWVFIHDNRHLLSSDGVHMTAEGYRQHADHLVAAVTG